LDCSSSFWQEEGHINLIMQSVTNIITRRNEVLRLRESGLTYAEIGHRLGMSREWARQITKGNPPLEKPELQSRVMLTTSDVAQLLGLHPNTVRRWNKKGILKSYRITHRGDRRFRREDVDSFLKGVEIG